MPGLTHDALSSPTLVDSPTTEEPSKRTNTLVLTQLPAPFFHPRVMDALREHFLCYGEIRAWAPLKAFARVILVYQSEDSADDAKLHCDGLEIDATPETSAFVLRVFRADPTPPTPPGGAHLRPPAIEKNFLISPPGSPPVGWEPIVEEPPNATPLAEDLIAALRKLQLAQAPLPTGREMLLDPEDGVGIGVYVEDCDVDVQGGDMEQDWIYGEGNPSRMILTPVPTALPPMPP
ncbi:Calcipressin-domain-containing protein [Gloeopeniophorella convolvens]|nr:Calcipressin-domain-containing protein [Gloeopeniophorella convolvens]